MERERECHQYPSRTTRSLGHLLPKGCGQDGDRFQNVSNKVSGLHVSNPKLTRSATHTKHAWSILECEFCQVISLYTRFSAARSGPKWSLKMNQYTYTVYTSCILMLASLDGAGCTLWSRQIMPAQNTCVKAKLS